MVENYNNYENIKSERIKYTDKNIRDKELLLKWKEGNTEAGNMLVKEYIPFIKNEAYKNNTKEASELFSIGLTLLSSCMRCYNTNSTTPFASYFSISLKREFNREKRNYIKYFNILNAEEDALYNIPDNNLINIENKILFNNIFKEIELFPNNARNIINMYIKEEKTFKEISKEINISENSVANIFNKYIKILRKKFNNY